MSRVWVFERIGGGVGTCGALALARVTGGKVFYAEGGGKSVRFWRGLFPKGKFQEMTSHYTLLDRTHLDLYRLVEERASRIDGLPFFKGFHRFLPHPKLGPLVRKYLISDGFFQFVLSLEVQKRKSAGERVCFLPQDSRPFLEEHFPSARRAIPRPWRFLLAAASVFQPFFYVLGNAWVLLRNGLALKLPPPKEWMIGQVAFGRMLPDALIFDGLIYGGGPLSPERILHVLKLPPSKEYLEYARAKNLPVVYPRRLRSTVGFFVRRFLKSYVPLVLRSLWNRIRHGVSPEVVKAVARIGGFVLETERLALHCRSRVFFGWDTFWVGGDVRAMVWDLMGGRFIGYIHGMPGTPHYIYHNTYMPVLLCPSEGVQEMFGETLQHVTKVVPVGVLTTELTVDADPEKVRSLRSKVEGRHLVAAFDTSFAPGWGLTEEVFDQFYDGLLELVERRNDVSLVLKRKNIGEENPSYDRLAARMEGHPRIRVTYEENTYHLLAAADSVIAIGCSTVGWEALACRKRAFFFDPREVYKTHTAWKYGPPLVCHAFPELLERFDQMRQGRYLDRELWDRIVSREACFADERPLTAARNLLLSELERLSPSGAAVS